MTPLPAYSCIVGSLTHLVVVLKRIPFVPPMLATAVKSPPFGPEWLHECKMDGFRCQVHLAEGEAVLYSRNGNDITRRFSSLRPALAEFPARAAIVDAELIACGANGLPDFPALIGRSEPRPLALWCFDLLSLDGIRLTPLPLGERKERLAYVVAAADDEHIQHSGGFSDAAKLMAACERLGHEGVVSKRIDSPYRSGRSNDWVKSKTTAWRVANADRYELLRGK